MSRFIIVMVAVLGGLMVAGAAMRQPAPARGFVFDEIDAAGRGYALATYVPRDYDAGQEWPLIVFLHGRGECGTDGQRQLAVGLGPRVLWNPERYPAVILFPQKPDHDSQWEDHLEAVGAMIERARAAYSIDDDRVYLTGLSQGGHGTWMINAAMPGTFAAIAPVCGYAQVPGEGAPRRTWTPDTEGAVFDGIADGAAGMPVWAFHGGADDVVPAAHTVELGRALKARGGDVRVTIYPEAGHGCWDAAYGDEAFSDWLFAQHRE